MTLPPPAARQQPPVRVPVPIHVRVPVSRGPCSDPGRALPTAVILLALLAPLAACDHSDPGTLSPRRDLRATIQLPSRPAVLLEHPLATHADYDGLEERLERRAGLGELIALYHQLRALRPDDRLLATRLALVMLRDREQVQPVLQVVDSVRKMAPEHPDTLYLVGAVTAILFHDAAAKLFAVQPAQAESARRLAEAWERLLELAPDYQGPKGVTAADLRRDIAALRLSIERAQAGEGGTAGMGAPLEGDAARFRELQARFYQSLEATGPTRDTCALAAEALRLRDDPELRAAQVRYCGSGAPRPPGG